MTAVLTRYRDQVDRSGASQVKGGQASCSDRASVWGRGGMLIALGGVLMLGAEAMGQVGTRYRAKVITIVGPPVDLHLPGFGDNTFGINNNSECCGGYVTGGAKVHAWMWLPLAADSFSAHTLYDLHALAGLPTGSPAERSFANSLSDDREIVGEYEIVDTSLAFSHAIAWDATNNTSPTPMAYTDLHPSSGYGPTSIAFAINNISPAQVAGSIDVHLCWSDPDQQWIRRGFVGTSNGSALDLLGQVSANMDLFAFDLTPSPSTATATEAVGRGTYVHTIVDEGNCQIEPIGTPVSCTGVEFFLEPYLWTQSMGFVPGMLDRLDTCSPWAGGAEARGTNDDGLIAGFAKLWPNCTGGVNTPCPTRATLTTGLSVAPFNLGSIMPAGQSTDYSRAEAIGNSHHVTDYLRVVGWNVFLNQGTIWERDDESNWCAEDLNVISIICDEGLVIRQAHDLNDHGHIIALGQNGSDFVAVYLTCRADLNGDGRVNNADRNLLLGAWLDELCDYDITGDTLIDESDLTVLSTTWSNNNICNIEPLPCHDLLEFNDTNRLQESLVTLGFTDANDFVTWWQTADPEVFETTWSLLLILMAQP